ncbi:hypothetical protein BD779DRAFT_1554696 [Infundibulicybe gibba]|nr:hypothetical protein BD779DRAFT_1554696 [Infundibulicybe gibba]
MKDWYNTVFVENSRTPEALATQGSCWVDIRDLAEAHTLALERASAAGERIIISAGPYVWQDWSNRRSQLTLPFSHPLHKLAKGIPGAGLKAVHKINYNTAKEARLLGVKYRSKEEMTRDTLIDIESRGW